MRILSIVGARPQFVKLAPICRAFERFGGIQHNIVHTGQHYDDAMSGSFFRDLAIPAPDVNLEVGSASHSVQTAEMMLRLEPVLLERRPNWVLLYGDTNSTLAGALVTSKMGLPMAHVEAGLRSFNSRMPEEINRVVTDHVSDLLFCPTEAAMENLRAEGLANGAVQTGDIMLDAVLTSLEVAKLRAGSPALELAEGSYALATVHRAENTDDASRLRAILEALDEIATSMCPVVLTIHPRTEKIAASFGWTPKSIRVIPPLPYLDMLLFESRARLILTDSGGVQKEAYFLKVPCITLRDETEWVETFANGCNVLAGASRERIVELATSGHTVGPWSEPYGHGRAADCIAEVLSTR